MESKLIGKLGVEFDVFAGGFYPMISKKIPSLASLPLKRGEERPLIGFRKNNKLFPHKSRPFSRTVAQNIRRLLLVPSRKKEIPMEKTGVYLATLQQKHKGKDIDSYNCQDFVLYFADRYQEVNGVPYFFNFVKESAMLKRLMGQLDNFSIVKLINYAITNKSEMGIGLLTSGWVNKFIKEAGIISPELSRYEMLLKSDYLTQKEKELVQEWLEKLEGYVLQEFDEGAKSYLELLKHAEVESKRRKSLLTSNN